MWFLTVYFYKDCSSSDKINALLMWKNSIGKQFNGILVLSSMTPDCMSCMKIELHEGTADMDDRLQKA